MSDAPRLSVVIPTHKRAAILRQCLEHLARQTAGDELEVIVVSDGPDSATAEMMNAFVATKHASPLLSSRVHFFDIPKSHQGSARNAGVAHASAPYVLFIGDDAFLAPDACAKHLSAHDSVQRDHGTNAAAVLGFTTWDPAVGITPVMRWLEQTGWQFGYPLLARHAHAFVPPHSQHRFTYTIHLSLPTVLARRHPFREDITLYGWEDILWGMKLRDAGIRLYYEPDAVALHHHHLSLEDSLRRMHILGQSAVQITQLDPSLDRLPRGWKKLAYRAIATLPTMRGRHAKAFLTGIRSMSS